MSRPKSVTVPPSGRSSPVTRLKSVVLPAPFGPIIHRRSPSATVRSTEAVTSRPPKDFVRLCTASAVDDAVTGRAPGPTRPPPPRPGPPAAP